MKTPKRLYCLATAICIFAAAKFLTVEPPTDGTTILSILFVALAFGFVVLFSVEANKK